VTLAFLALVGCAGAPPDDGVWSTGERGVEATLSDGNTVRLSAHRPTGRAWVYAVTNDNDRYVVRADVSASLSGRAALRLGERTWPARAVSTTPEGDVAEFEVDRAGADAAAALFGVPRRDREPLDGGLEGAFRVDAATLGGPVGVVLRLEKRAGPEVALVTGGASGPRDPRFHFEVRRDGAVLAERSGLGFGAARSIRVLRPGDAIELPVDLAAWVDVSAPGAYAAACRYTGELQPPDAASDPDDLHRRWEIRVDGEISFTLPPPSG
jgi:hypothetical protein